MVGEVNINPGMGYEELDDGQKVFTAGNEQRRTKELRVPPVYVNCGVSGKEIFRKSEIPRGTCIPKLLLLSQVKRRGHRRKRKEGEEKGNGRWKVRNRKEIKKRRSKKREKKEEAKREKEKVKEESVVTFSQHFSWTIFSLFLPPTSSVQDILA